MCMHMRGHVQQSPQCEFGNEFHTAARGFQESEAASAGTCARISVFLHHLLASARFANRRHKKTKHKTAGARTLKSSEAGPNADQ